jgi:hypothetical protein
VSKSNGIPVIRAHLALKAGFKYHIPLRELELLGDLTGVGTPCCTSTEVLKE